MVNKIIQDNKVSAPYQEIPQVNQKQPADKPLEVAKKAIENAPKEANSSLCDRVIKVLKNILHKIQACFSKCYQKKIDKNAKAPVVPVIEENKDEKDIKDAKDVKVPLEEIVEEKKDANEEQLNQLKKKYELEKLIIPFPHVEKKAADYKISEESYKRAMDLMMNNQAEFPSIEQQMQNYADLKKAIDFILPEHIDLEAYFMDDNIERNTTLLLQAMRIKDQSQRHEIVEMLLRRGVDPQNQGTDKQILFGHLAAGIYHRKFDPYTEAEKIGDQHLTKMILIAKNEKLDPPIIEEKNNEKERASSERAFVEAIDLMFNAGNLQERLNLMEHEPKGYSQEKQTQRHENLKKSLEKIDPKYINAKIGYFEGMGTFTTTLLIHAIKHIQDPKRCLEIVSILLDKGSDPRVEGFYYVPCDLMTYANNTANNELKALLKDKKDELIGKAVKIPRDHFILDVHQYINAQPIDPLNDRELKVVEESKKALNQAFDFLTSNKNYAKSFLNKILPEHINDEFDVIELGDRPAILKTNLLLKAIMKIKDATDRREIVALLLKQGADPQRKGSRHDNKLDQHFELDPIEEARLYNDDELNKLLADAVLKLKGKN